MAGSRASPWLMVFCSARKTGLAGNDAMASHHGVVPDLDQIINFRPFADHGIDQRAAVDLGNFHHFSRARRPLDRADVAHKAAWVAVALRSPRNHDLPASLLYFSQGDGVGRSGKARLFGEFAAGRVQRLFALGILPLRDRPRPQVFPGPEGTARMHQE